jgi:5-methylcytosine-specific restriction endonuclease McrA
MAKTSTCHPNRKHVSGGLCGPCYRLELAKRNHPGWKNQRCICGCGQVPYPGSKYVKSHVHRKMSPEHRANLSKAGKGRPGNPKAIAAAAAWHRGRPMTEKQRLALLNANLGRSPTPEDRAKKRAAHLGRKPSEMARLAVAEANRQRVWTDEMRQKHWNWKGGKQKGYPVHWHAISERIRDRDGLECMLCHAGTPPHNRKKHDVHHLDGNSLNVDPRNLITLCVKCHGACHRDVFNTMPILHDILAERYGYVYD